MKTERSLRRDLLRWLMGPLVVLLGVGAFGDYLMALHPSTTAYDEALFNTALALAENTTATGAGLSLDLPAIAERVLTTDRRDRVYFAVIGPHGELVAGSGGLPGPPRTGRPGKPVYYDGQYEGNRVRVVALNLDKAGLPIHVLVAETTAKREKLIRQILVSMLVPEVLFAVAVLALIWLGIRRGLASLDRLRSAISTRSPRHLQPVPEDHAPLEVRPVIEALNDLLERLKESLGAQQRFIADAAHQLRTPIAGLQAQVELASQETSPAQWRAAMDRLRVATGRTAHLANQLLALARAEPGAGGVGKFQPVNLCDLAREAAGEWVPRAVAHGVDLGFELQVARIQGEPFLLRGLLSNLIDNAINYGGADGHVTVRTGTRDGIPYLAVEDKGPGIPGTEREKVFKRFYRPAGTKGEGCGLGLAIVQEIVHAHGGEVHIFTPSDGHGTLVMVLFPRPE